MKDKMKSWAMWLALAALMIYVVRVIFRIDISAEIKGFMDVLLPVLIGFGIVNNPNDRVHL